MLRGHLLCGGSPGHSSHVQSVPHSRQLEHASVLCECDLHDRGRTLVLSFVPVLHLSYQTPDPFSKWPHAGTTSGTLKALMPTSQSPNPDLIGMECAWASVFFQSSPGDFDLKSGFPFQRVEVVPICIPQHIVGAQQIVSISSLVIKMNCKYAKLYSIYEFVS